MSYQKTEHIAAGCLKADIRSSSIYQAYLGTCLGVALYDTTLKVGGMIHILLPEPLGNAGAHIPEKYASTGIPMLINQFIGRGSSPQNIKAVIAGGALVGPVSHQDIGLDIGGRSADIARKILQRHNIEVIKSETGGFFICTLELNMRTGETAINPAWEDVCKSQQEITPPTLDDIKKTGRAPANKAYTAGLLHDIGKVILDQYISNRAPLLFRNLSIETESFLSAEKKLLGITHCEVGAFLAKKWQFSSALSQAIRHHHHPEKTEDNKNLVYIVYLADLLMEKFHTGHDLEKMQTQSISHVLAHLGLTLADIPEIIDATPLNVMNTNE